MTELGGGDLGVSRIFHYQETYYMGANDSLGGHQVCTLLSLICTKPIQFVRGSSALFVLL